jgi:hypothetical protein
VMLCNMIPSLLYVQYNYLYILAIANILLSVPTTYIMPSLSTYLCESLSTYLCESLSYISLRTLPSHHYAASDLNYKNVFMLASKLTILTILITSVSASASFIDLSTKKFFGNSPSLIVNLLTILLFSCPKV